MVSRRSGIVHSLGSLEVGVKPLKSQLSLLPLNLGGEIRNLLLRLPTRFLQKLSLLFGELRRNRTRDESHHNKDRDQLDSAHGSIVHSASGAQLAV